MHRAILIVTICLTSAAALPAQEWQASRVWTAGSQDHAWVIGAADMADSALPVLQIWYAGKTTEAEVPSLLPTLPPIGGNPIAIAADARGLRVLFADLTQCDYFADQPLSPGPRWQDQSGKQPLAWCGDALLPNVWAVVSSESLTPTTTRRGEPDALDQEDETTDGDEDVADIELSPAPRPSSANTLLRLSGGIWSRLDGPTAADTASQFWIAARSDVVHLFWRNGASILAATLKDGRWTEPGTVCPSTETRLAWVGTTEEGPVLLAGVQPDGDPMHLHVYAPDQEGQWSRLGILRENDDYLQLDPLRCHLAINRNQIAIARIGKGGSVEYGLADTATRSPVRFLTLSMRRPEVARPSDLRDSMALAMALMILTVVMWTRRQQLTGEIVLPKGVVPSAVWRRIMATFLDMAPAALVMATWVMKAIPELSHESDLTSFREQMDRPEIQAKLMPIHYASVIVYAIWCAIWELLISATPGKYLFGCRVLSATGDKPAPRQIIVRNIIRAIMVGIGPPGWIITLMMMGMLSRNRQRVGDLMASTIVVEDAVIEEERPPPPDEGPFG